MPSNAQPARSVPASAPQRVEAPPRHPPLRAVPPLGVAVPAGRPVSPREAEPRTAPPERAPSRPAAARAAVRPAPEEERGSRGWELTLFRHLNYPGTRR
ncbi:hypothetical protein [Herbiconiux ginsengi]|uniref:Uncharacterized protein n=1 Tax=Herbiconiux ginsengi TaxID=381665 RepID=A0A1H3MHD5_9MICO|nr:hypothetical protein [Herbiconiux ginsengi]SDY76046.1 hypothetical protein SAMN05216554_1425 [Herbiconiux ginsengi]